MTGGTLVEIDRDECLELVATQPVGRLAVAVEGAAPMVVPVNYQLDGDVVVFRSAPGLKTKLLQKEPVSFEVDLIDWPSRTGWSVLIRGRAYLATHWETDHLDLRAWAEGEKEIWVRIAPDEITGRRLLAGDLGWPIESRGYI